MGLLNKDESHEEVLSDNNRKDNVQEKTNSSFLPPIEVSKSLDFKPKASTKYNS
jgi:hypothetical protein